MLLSGLLRAVRLRQWTKNLLALVPLLFSFNEAWRLDDSSALPALFCAAEAFALFCVLSSSVYLINDAMDAEQDRAHPLKRFRPIAAGVVPVPVAFSIGCALALAAVSFAFALSPSLGVTALAYVAIQVMYSVWLKHVVLLDVACVSSGFVLRILAGALALDVPISPWLYICSGLAALFVALSKRRSELSQAGEGSGRQRQSLDAYTLPMLDQMTGVVATAALVGYALYTFTAENLPANHSMMLTIPFVLYGLFRYMYLVHTADAGEKPDELITSDVPMMAAVALWTATAAGALFFGR